MQHRDSLQAFAEAFLELNQQINLSASRDLESLWQRHILDSLALLELPEIRGAKRLLDLGSGGGFPGVPLAISSPKLQVTLLDSVQKKMRAVQTLTTQLGISNVGVLAGRAEDFARMPAHRQAYDVVVARAVARLPVLLEYAAPLAARQGFVIALKGPDPEEEIAEAEIARQRLRLDPPRIQAYTLADQRFTHVIYPLRQYVPRAYPRAQGLPKRKPLGSEGGPGALPSARAADDIGDPT